MTGWGDDGRRLVRFLFGSVPRFLVTGVVAGVLVVGGLVGGAWLSSDGRGCPEAVARASEGEVAGEYEGLDGMRVRLRYDPGAGRGTFSVAHWPYEGSPAYRKEKTFGAAGTWSLSQASGVAETRVRLSFDDRPAHRRPLETLVVGREGDERVLFKETDPDNCPSTVLRRAGS
ncbi:MULTISPECIES: hypothetical protein [Streptomyces]|uniref:hypothetical protein n=1 Tax=Streptomyces TaxID=1883 RepID=UPI00163C92B2|nr:MULTISPECIES: hypothetical protein [Streptomyces]MBC2877214.1 hypothetical protein [Streptomyces sp. TYQ1024]UBI39480.1 hypothetical protein K7I03_25435 [Streptomyces mobaraensis]UKW32059.1 hypothetical protein MCU78_25370 [Streptomyces sp. TYQ1024]